MSLFLVKGQGDQHDRPASIAAYGNELYARFLTDSSGANLSIRIDDKIIMTPKRAGARWHWLEPDPKPGARCGYSWGQTGRRWRNFAGGARAFYAPARVLPASHGGYPYPRPQRDGFCAVELPMPPVLECTELFGVIEQTRCAASESQDLAEATLQKIRENGGVSHNPAACCMAPAPRLVCACQRYL